jgi:hypothetical protein
MLPLVTAVIKGDESGWPGTINPVETRWSVSVISKTLAGPESAVWHEVHWVPKIVIADGE